jgi:hypothetical protein
LGRRRILLLKELKLFRKISYTEVTSRYIHFTPPPLGQINSLLLSYGSNLIKQTVNMQYRGRPDRLPVTHTQLEHATDRKMTEVIGQG